MPRHLYSLTIDRQVGGSALNPWYTKLSGVAKVSIPGHPFVLYNEAVAATIATTLGLPIPPWLLGSFRDQIAFVSMDIQAAGGQLPPGHPPDVVTAHPETSWGVVAFDCWIANGDRHPGNLAYLSSLKQLFIFDHSHTLLLNTGDAQLQQVANNHCLAGHCLLPHMADLKGLEKWLTRIESFPDYVITDVVERLRDYELAELEAKALEQFLITRKAKVRELMRTAIQAHAPKVPQALWPSI